MYMVAKSSSSPAARVPWCRRAGVGARAGVLVCALAGVVACGPANEVDVVAIGATLPLSGSESAAADAVRRGYERAVAEVNAAGGLWLESPQARVPVRLVLRDDGADAAAAERLARALYLEGVHVMLGTYGDVRSAVQSAVAERLDRPYLVCEEDAPGLPGSQQRWTSSVRAVGDAESRAYRTARTLIQSIEAAGTTDAERMRIAIATRHHRRARR
jgi:ABC-type branched-subunit amino acid transport system substrate-binding protein